jgi:uncharacterized cupredoxin-like copper-binding protein
MWRKAFVLTLVMPAVILAGCGSDDADADASATTAAGPPECEIVGGTETDAVAEVQVTLEEWKITADTATVAAGAVRFETTNTGEDDHELVLVKGAKPEQLSITADGLDEEALPAGAEVLGEIEGFPGGETCEGTFELTAGDYALVCNIVEESEHEAHAQLGMVTAFTVS